jgi:hypothetical protein
MMKFWLFFLMDSEKLFKFSIPGDLLPEEKYYNEYQTKGDQTYLNK